MRKLTDAQVKVLRMVERRDWPAGEPRLGWLHLNTAYRLLREGLISTRPGSESERAGHRSPVVDLTPAGREALATHQEDDHAD